MKKILLLPILMLICCLKLSAQLDIATCDTINFAELGQCYPMDFSFSNFAFSDDNCDNDSIFWKVYVDIWSDGLYEYEFNSFFDPMDESSSGDINDNGVIEIYLSTTTSGQTINISFTEDIINSGFHHTLTWNATDRCGNEVYCNSAFLVLDNIAPTIECIEEDYIVYTTDDGNDIELKLDKVILSVMDNCSPEDSLIFTLGDSAEAPSLEFSVLTGDTALDLNVFDEQGNSATCSFNIDFIELPFPFLASVEDVSGNLMSNVEVTIISDDPFDTVDITVNNVTNEKGEFVAFVSQDFDYSIQAEFNDFRKGLSTRDLILLNEFIDNNNSITSPFSIIACDVNYDFNVDHEDVDYLHDILFDVNADNKLWKFLYESIEFEDESNPFPYAEGIVHIAETDWQSKDLIGVKLGDVDHSALEPPSDLDTLHLTARNVVVQEDEVIEVDLFMPVGTDVKGLQLNLDHGMEFLDVISGTLNIEKADIKSKPSSLLLTCIDGNVMTDTPAFTLVFRGKRCTELSKLIGVSDDFFNPEKTLVGEVYLGENLRVHPLDLDIKGEVEYQNILFQPTPNPFNESTSISFQLAENGNAQIKVYDLTGKLIIESELTEFQKGKNTILLSRGDFIGQQSGMYIIHVDLRSGNMDNSNHVFSKRVFFLSGS